jgi:hypothetical protein
MTDDGSASATGHRSVTSRPVPGQRSPAGVFVILVRGRRETRSGDRTRFVQWDLPGLFGVVRVVALMRGSTGPLVRVRGLVEGFQGVEWVHTLPLEDTETDVPSVLR